MKAVPAQPALYQINTRVWLTELSKSLGRPATLDDIPDAGLDRLAELGFDWSWLLSVWQTGMAAQQVSRSNPNWRKEFQDTLPDLRDEDIGGSGFAIQSYTVHGDLGGAAALARVRQRLQQRGLRLMLDFVPNHMAPDHPWIDEHPDYFVHGSEDDLARAPQNYCRVQTKRGPLVLAYGRDPYFAGWPDTLQLSYGNPDLQQAMIGELERIAGQCDGERLLAAVNYAPNQSQCYVRLPFADLGAGEWRLQNQLEDVGYDRDGSALQSCGLYLDVPPWQASLACSTDWTSTFWIVSPKKTD